MNWKHLLLSFIVSIVAFFTTATGAENSADEMRPESQKHQRGKEELENQGRFRRTTQRMLLERKFLITQKQKLSRIAKNNPLARKYIRIINLQLLYIERELKEQRRESCRPKA
jgi:hypothetical protein